MLQVEARKRFTKTGFVNTNHVKQTYQYITLRNYVLITDLSHTPELEVTYQRSKIMDDLLNQISNLKKFNRSLLLNNDLLRQELFEVQKLYEEFELSVVLNTDDEGNYAK